MTISQRTQAMQRAQSRDGLVNVVSGMGTNAAKRSYNAWQFDCYNNWQQLDAAYQSNWIARQIVDVPAQDATREWRRIKSVSAEEITSLEQDFLIPSLVEEAVSWARLYGGAGIVMITDQDLEQPLNINAIGRGSLRQMVVFDRHDLTPTHLNVTNILSPNYLQPEFYQVLGGQQRIHWTHVARFMGAKIPRRQRILTQGWGDSELRKCLSDVADMVAAKDGIAELMQEANVDVIQAKGLNDDLASDQDEEIIKRYDSISQLKSIVNMILLDEGEVYTRNTLALSGVAPVLEVFQSWISGCAKIPLTKIFGTSAKGLNATGEGDAKNYNDDVRALQTSGIAQPLRLIDAIVSRSAVGSMPEDFDYIWNPLVQSNEVETAQAQLLQAQKASIHLADGVVQRSQVMRELQANEEYQFDDDELEQLENDEEGNLFEGLVDLSQQGQEIVAPGSNALPAPPTSDAEFIDRYSALIGKGATHDEAIHELT